MLQDIPILLQHQFTVIFADVVAKAVLAGHFHIKDQF